MRDRCGPGVGRGRGRGGRRGERAEEACDQGRPLEDRDLQEKDDGTQRDTRAGGGDPSGVPHHRPDDRARGGPQRDSDADLAPALSHRPASPADLPALRALMAASIREIIGQWLDPPRVEASFEIMGVDTQLIDDGTYFVVECDGRIAGCGGWSRRGTLFGGDAAAARDARLLDPAREPARIRAMYTHPEYVRRGIGRLVLGLCEAAAADAGFRSVELVATLAGEPLYAACGYAVVQRIEVPTSSGITVPCARMAKPLARPA